MRRPVLSSQVHRPLHQPKNNEPPPRNPGGWSNMSRNDIDSEVVFSSYGVNVLYDSNESMYQSPLSPRPKPFVFVDPSRINSIAIELLVIDLVFQAASPEAGQLAAGSTAAIASKPVWEDPDLNSTQILLVWSHGISTRVVPCCPQTLPRPHIIIEQFAPIEPQWRS